MKRIDEKQKWQKWGRSGARTCDSNTLGFVSFEKESAPRQVGTLSTKLVLTSTRLARGGKSQKKRKENTVHAANQN